MNFICLPVADESFAEGVRLGLAEQNFNVAALPSPQASNLNANFMAEEVPAPKLKRAETEFVPHNGSMDKILRLLKPSVLKKALCSDT